MKDRSVCAEFLFDEMGLIDDRIICEAAAFSPAPAKKRFLPLKIAFAAALSTVLTFALVAVLFAGIRKRIIPSIVSSYDPLTTALGEYRNFDGYDVVATAEQIDLFDGTAKLIWQYSDQSSYCVLDLKAGQMSDIQRNLGYGKDFSGESKVGCQVWIADGDGATVSPYLKKSDGNVGYGTLISYSPEIVPSSSMTEIISQIIEAGENKI